MALRGHTTRAIRFTGTDTVIRNMNGSIAKIRNQTKAGLYAAGLMIKEKALRLTPIELGNLRGSTYVNPPILAPQGPVVEVGYTAAYAVYVHERTELHHDPPTQAKFLEDAIKMNTKEILGIIRQVGVV